jgi:hypothetical protein
MESQQLHDAILCGHGNLCGKPTRAAFDVFIDFRFTGWERRNFKRGRASSRVLM